MLGEMCRRQQLSAVATIWMLMMSLTENYLHAHQILTQTIQVMTQLLQHLSKELESNFTSHESLEQLHSNLQLLAEQLQILITTINQNRFSRTDVELPNFGVVEQIRLIESLTREATQIQRNWQAEAVTKCALDKEIKHRKRILKKLKHVNNNTSTASWLCRQQGSDSPMLRNSFQSTSLSPIRESIPLPPPSPSPTPTVRFRFGSRARSTGSPASVAVDTLRLDTDDLLEFDLVPILESPIDEEVLNLLGDTD